MSYSTDVPFVSTGASPSSPGDICSHVTQVLGSSYNCMALSQARCGNGQLESGEECDDGGTISGDGCSPDCFVECEWLCTQPQQLATQPSSCQRHCGDGELQLQLGEECDDSSACCLQCKLAESAHCSGGECCSASCGREPVSTHCQNGAGFCAHGRCDVDWPASLGRYLVGDLSSYVDTASCPVDGCLFRFALRDEAGVSSYGEADASPPPCWGYAPNPFKVTDGLLCTMPSSGGGLESGTCDGGQCVLSGGCGDGVVGVGEDCDDASKCCAACSFQGEAQCSPPGSCCTSDCRTEGYLSRHY